jgi:hypothetical protein
MKRAALYLLLVLVLTAPVMAQFVAPSKSGMVSAVEGVVTLDGETLPDPLVANFPYMKENGVLSTAEGRAELLMNPSVAMRVGENSQVRLISNRFIDTRVELMSGAAVVECLELNKDNSFTLVLKDAQISVSKAGNYRFDAEPARVKVYEGLARVTVAGKTIEVPGGKLLDLSGGEAALQKFDREQLDALDRWSARRSETAAMANASSAKESWDRYGSNRRGRNGQPCVSYGGYGASGVIQDPSCGWVWNPWFNIWTYIPGRVVCTYSGVCFYTPADAYARYYAPRPVYRPSQPSMPSIGYSGAPATSSGSSGTASYSTTTVSSSPSAGSGSSAASSSAASSVGHGSAGSGGNGR